MWSPRLVLLFGLLSTSASAVENKCDIELISPSGWESKEISPGILLQSPSINGSITISCMVLEKSLSDIEFMLYVGTEEPSEAPPLKKLGEFRGQLGAIFPDQHREWFLLKDKVYVHVVLSVEDESLYKGLINTVGETIETFKIVL